MNGAQLDTTCSDILNATSISPLVDSNLTGLQYFKSALVLDLYGGYDVFYNPVYHVTGAFPPNLTDLEIYKSPIRYITATLPASLKKLVLQYDGPGNGLVALPNLPTGLTYLDCSNDALLSLPTLPAALTYFNCSSNSLSTVPSLPTGLTSFNCSWNNITTLPGLPSTLDTLICSANSLSALPILPTGLTYLDCGANSIPTLPVLPNGLLYLDCSENDYSINSNYYSIGFPAALPPGLQTFIYIGNMFNNSATPALPSSLLYIAMGSSGLIDEPDFSTCPNLIHLSLYHAEYNPWYMNWLTYPLPNSIKFLDVSGCQFGYLGSLPTSLDTLVCENNVLTSLPDLPAGLTFLDISNTYPYYSQSNYINQLPALPNTLQTLIGDENPLTTLPALDASLQYLTVSNDSLVELPSLPPYLSTLDVSNNRSLACLPMLTTIASFNFSGDAITCLPNYGQVTNSSPSLNEYPLCGLLNTCPYYWNINGSVYFNAANNCIHQPGEPYMYPIKMNLYQNGSLLQQAIFPGVYSFKTGLGNYTVTIDSTGLPFAADCPSDSLVVAVTAGDSLVSNVNFEVQCEPGFDVGVNAVVDFNGFFPGELSFVNIAAGDRVLERYGISCNTAGLSGQVKVTLSGPVTYSGTYGTTPAPDSVNGNIITWNVADYSQLSAPFQIKVLTDSTAKFGTPVCINVYVTPTAGDYDTTNNDVTQCLGVIDSHDPNFKEVSPPGDLEYPYTGWLTYTIHFQNTGNAPAQNIRITDTLDANADPTTFQLLAYSTAPLVQITGRYITFSFPQINLPDSAANSDGSIGYVQYRVKPLANLAPGNTISNLAYIYFDLNAPVVTNAVTSSVAGATGINNMEPVNTISIYPNPNSTGNWQLAVSNHLIGAKLEMYDALGGLVYQSEIQSLKSEIPATGLPSGVYIVRVSTPGAIETLKVVKE